MALNFEEYTPGVERNRNIFALCNRLGRVRGRPFFSASCDKFGVFILLNYSDYFVSGRICQSRVIGLIH